MPTEQANQGLGVDVPADGTVLNSSNRGLALKTRLSVRNTDPKTSLRLNSARAFDRKGRELSTLLKRPQEVGPMAAIPLPEHGNAEEGSTARTEIASFVLEWSADGAINRPLIEAIVIGDSGSIVIRQGKSIERW